jgi:circadian clock protein KaiC
MNSGEIPTNGSGLAALGIPGLDEVLCGGLPRNRLYLVQGDPGTGKTTLALQYLLEGVRQGEQVLYITLSETREEVTEVVRSHGWSLEGVALFELSAADQTLSIDQDNTLFNPSEIELHETMRSLLTEVERVQPTRVVFDSMAELRLLAQSSLRYRRQILALKQYFTGRACTVLLLDDCTSEADDLQLQTLAHGVLTLDHLAPGYGGDRRRLRVKKLRGVRFRGGFHDFKIERGGVAVFPRLVAAEHRAVPRREQVPSGLRELDQLLGGGLDRGSSTLVIGPAGSGKSSVALRWATSVAASGQRATLFQFEEGPGTLHARAAALGMPLEPLLQAGHLVIHQIDPAELAPGELVHLMREEVDRHDSRVVVVDSLNGYLNAMPEERFLTIQLHEVLTYLNQKGVTTILVMAQHGFLGHMVTPTDVSYLADTVILLRYFESRGAVRKAISVVKKRGGHHEDTIREFIMQPGGILIGRPLSDFQGVLTGVPTFLGGNADLFGERGERKHD